MATQVAPLGLRLFLEGIEVPVIAAQVSAQPSQPAVAAIQIVPTDSALLFLPRTLVHLFYLDSELTIEDRAISDRILAEQELFPESRRTKIDRFDVEDERYKILFTGEVVGFNYQKTPSSRSLVLQCLDLSSYWDTCYQWFAEFAVGGNGLTDRTHHFVGAGEGLFNDIASGTRWVIGNILTTKPANPEYKNTTGLLAGYIHLLESIGGLRPKAGKQGYAGFRGVNDFFTIAELKYNLSGMIGAVADDTTSARLYAHKAFFNWLEQGMASAGSLVSYRDVLRLVGQYIFHDVYPNPVARFVKGGAKVQQTLTHVYKESKVGKKVADEIQKAIDRLNSARSALNGAIGANNTASIPFDEARTALFDAGNHISAALTNLTDTKTTDAPAVRAELSLAQSQVQDVDTSFNQAARRNAGNDEDLINVEQARELGSRLDAPIALLDKVFSASATKRKTETVDVTTSDHLFNQLLLPETFFVVPPRCNVIFPDQYSNFSFSRNFLREVTRLSVQGGLGIISGGRRGDAILSRYYFAPNIRDVRGKIARKTIFSQGSTLLPHEIHSGIIPKFEWVTDGHRWGIKAARTQGKTTEEKKKISYIQRLANFQFFLNRFAARQMSCSMRFSPNLVTGFPAIVIDRTSPSAAVIETLSDVLEVGRSVLPTAYIGKIVSLTHEINQAGGTTSVVLSHARTHRGIDDEFLGVVARERKDVVDREVVVDTSLFGPGTDLNDTEEAKLLVKHLSKTLSIGASFREEKVTSVSEDPETIPMSFATLSLIGLPLDAFQKILVEQSLAGLDEDVSTINVTKKLTVGLRRKTNLGKFVTPTNSFSPEELLQPGWYSPVWDRESITKSVYLPLLGCAAVTDDQTIGDASGFAGILAQALSMAGITDAVASVREEGRGVVIEIQSKTIAAFDVATNTLEQAIDSLTVLYGILKNRDLDVQQFINDYTRRPIANLTEILGSSNLEFDDNGDVKDTSTMIEGFHSRAFGDYNTDVKHRNEPVDENETDGAEPVAGTKALFGLIPADKKATFVRGIADRGRKLPEVPPYLDPRGRARQRVLAYAKELEVSRGILGGT
jgi:hypothetical protein